MLACATNEMALKTLSRKRNIYIMKYRIERAEAAVEMAKLNLSYCVVVAPCDGKLVLDIIILILVIITIGCGVILYE